MKHTVIIAVLLIFVLGCGKSQSLQAIPKAWNDMSPQEQKEAETDKTSPYYKTPREQPAIAEQLPPDEPYQKKNRLCLAGKRNGIEVELFLSMVTVDANDMLMAVVTNRPNMSMHLLFPMIIRNTTGKELHLNNLDDRIQLRMADGVFVPLVVNNSISKYPTSVKSGSTSDEFYGTLLALANDIDKIQRNFSEITEDIEKAAPARRGKMVRNIPITGRVVLNGTEIRLLPKIVER